MILCGSFEKFISQLEVSNFESIVARFEKITKRLNEDFHEMSGDSISNSLVIGSLGRGTAINGISDLDMIFEMPESLYYKYNSYSNNGQSALLQSVKESIKKTYSSTTVRGDGQVVVIDFSSSNDVIEICPCFRNADDSFTYPDSNNGGKWKKTDPIPEQEESEKMKEISNNVFIHLCQMVRAWKNNKSVKINGLLIDTLVNEFLIDNDEYLASSFDDYLSLTRDFFGYVSKLNKEQKYWFALGSNQHVYNKNNGQFIEAAKEAFDLLAEIDVESDNVYIYLRDIFGSEFPLDIESTDSLQVSSYDLRAPGEEFIDLDYRYPIRIKNSLIVECIATSPSKKKIYLSRSPFIGRGCTLDFFINETDVFGEYRVFWKVRNRGCIAKNKGMLRGEIRESITINETSDFFGSHFVECYVVKNEECVAKDRLVVNIMKTLAH
jgi:hypothetical protein